LISPNCDAGHSTRAVLLAGLLVLIVIVAATTRLVPHGTAAEMATPQQLYFHLQNDDALIAKP
jgi:hypothetical protein